MHAAVNLLLLKVKQVGGSTAVLVLVAAGAAGAAALVRWADGGRGSCSGGEPTEHGSIYTAATETEENAN